MSSGSSQFVVPQRTTAAQHTRPTSTNVVNMAITNNWIVHLRLNRFDNATKEDAQMDPVTEAIKRRYSCRNYSEAPLSPKVVQQIEALLEGSHTGPFGNTVRFKLLDFGQDGARSGRLGTYGFIRNARMFVAGAVRPAEQYLTDYGYCLERVVLALTRLDLGTCWLAATFDRARLKAQFGLAAGEAIPAVTPVGYPADGKTVVGHLIRLMARSDKRRPWPDLFHETASGQPLSPEAAGAYSEALECVRLAPSTANRQPWRVFANVEDEVFDFYARGKPSVDLGIAMLHFEQAAEEAGLKGEWSRREAARPGLTYVATWRAGVAAE